MSTKSRMRNLLSSRAYFNPNDVADEIANGSFKVPRDVHLDEIDELAAHLACWVAMEGHEFIELDNKDDEDLIALLANIAATAMRVQHQADLRASRINKDNGGDGLG
jgi:hypothetical protein